MFSSGVEVLALAAEADPMIETRLRRVVVVPHVPLADKGGRVARLAEILGKENGPLRHRPLVVDHAVVMHVLAGQDRSPAGRTQRRADEGVGQVRSLGRHPVQVRRFQELGGVGQEAQEVVAVVVAEHQHDVPPRGLFSRRGGEGWDAGPSRDRGQEQPGDKTANCDEGTLGDSLFWSASPLSHGLIEPNG